ncbi:MAG: hypothetical protein KGL48_14035 [Sphingomonadales bacterium]|nr:hypothetical protein [Sphingomonadales bacterium]
MADTAPALHHTDGRAPAEMMSYDEASTALKSCKARLAALNLAEKQERFANAIEVHEGITKLGRETRAAIFAIIDPLAAQITGMITSWDVHEAMTLEMRAAIKTMIAKAQKEREES